MPPTTRSKTRHNASGRLPVKNPQKKAKGGITMPRSKKSKEPHLQVAVDDIRGFAEPNEATLPDPADRFTKGDKVQNRGLHAEVYASQGPQGMVLGKVLTQSSVNTHMKRQVYSVEAITKTWVQKLPSCASCQSRGTAPIRGCSNCRREYEDLILPDGNEY